MKKVRTVTVGNEYKGTFWADKNVLIYDRGMLTLLYSFI